jgi:hypothetical protein
MMRQKVTPVALLARTILVPHQHLLVSLPLVAPISFQEFSHTHAMISHTAIPAAKHAPILLATHHLSLVQRRRVAISSRAQSPTPALT